VFDFVEGKDLLRLITDAKFEPLKEEPAKKIMRGLIATMIGVHKNRVVHHDLKLENVLVNPVTLATTLIDFGLADIVPADNDIVSGDAGSYEYLPPEKVFTDKRKAYNGFKADIWSIGTIMYALLFAQFPWSKRERKDYLESKKVHPKLAFPAHRAHVSANARDLITAMLNMDPIARISLEDALEHPWLKDEERVSNLQQAAMVSSMKRSMSAGDY